MAGAAPDDNGGRLLTPAQVARMWYVSTPTAQRRIAEGRLPAIRLPGGHYRIRSQDANGGLDCQARNP